MSTEWTQHLPNHRGSESGGGFPAERWGDEVPVGLLCTALPAFPRSLLHGPGASGACVRMWMGPTWLLRFPPSPVLRLTQTESLLTPKLICKPQTVEKPLFPPLPASLTHDVGSHRPGGSLRLRPQLSGPAVPEQWHGNKTQRSVTQVSFGFWGNLWPWTVRKGNRAKKENSSSLDLKQSMEPSHTCKVAEGPREARGL